MFASAAKRYCALVGVNYPPNLLESEEQADSKERTIELKNGLNAWKGHAPKRGATAIAIAFVLALLVPNVEFVVRQELIQELMDQKQQRLE